MAPKLMESFEVVKLISDSYADKHVDGGYISMDNLVERRRLVRAVIDYGMPLKYVFDGQIRYKEDISDRSLMINDQVSAILIAERKEIIREVAGKNITAVHDSTPFCVDVIASFIYCVEEH